MKIALLTLMLIFSTLFPGSLGEGLNPSLFIYASSFCFLGSQKVRA